MIDAEIIRELTGRKAIARNDGLIDFELTTSPERLDTGVISRRCHCRLLSPTEDRRS